MELLYLSDLKTTSYQEMHKKRKPRFNKKSFGLSNYRDETGITRFNRTDNWGVDFSTFIKILEKGEI